MAVAENSYSSGLASDLSREETKNTSYLDARNIRITNDEILGFGAVENIKGTKFSLKIPKTYPVYKLEFVPPSVPSVYTINFTQTIIGLAISININVTSKTTILELYNIINAQISSSYSNMSIRVWYNNNHIIFSTYEDFTINSSGGFITTVLVPSQENPFIIGWQVVGDYIVIFTTDKSNELNSDESPILGPGQIWVCKYDESTDLVYNNESLQSLLLNGDPLNANHLIYNNNLDFSRGNAIMNEIEGRIENDGVIRVIWTDNYNKLRTINIKDPQVFAIPIGDINVNTSVKLTQPTIKKLLNSGSINNGKIGYFYSLRDNNGGITSFSPLSGLISTNPGLDGDFTNYQNFQGGTIGGNSGKAVQFEITDIDNNFDIIELYYVLYEVENLPQIFKFREEPVSNTTMTFIHTGDITNDTPISYSEFLRLRKSFDTCKTLASKNNILFVANTKTSTSDFSSIFDSRAYRFNASTINLDLYKKDSSASTYTINSNSDYLTIPETHDAINPFNDESGTCFGLFNSAFTPAMYDANTGGYYGQKYQRNSTILGGSGPNISYTFTTRQFTGDNYFPAGASTPDTSPFFSSDIYSGGSEGLGILHQNYTRTGTYDDLKSPYASYMFTGHARGEVYRYGITFYDIEGYPSFTQWIGDIKFPFGSDTGYELSAYSDPKQVLRTIGIKFTLDTSTAQFQALKDKITGWRFVRVERTEANKTKLGTGVSFDTFTGDVRLADGTLKSTVDKINKPANGYLPPISPSTKNIVKASIIDFNQYSYKSGDYLKTTHTYNTTGNQYYNVGSSTAEWFKYRAITSSPNTRRTINTQAIVEDASALSTNITGGNEFYNVVCEDGASAKVFGLGQKSHWLQMGDNIVANSIASYERYNLSQYGGPGYIDRTDNTYISTGHFQPYDPYNSSNPINAISPTDVFGGDTFTMFYSSLFYCFASFGSTAANYGYLNGSDGEESAVVFPCEAPINSYLRQGIHWAKDRDNTNMGAFLFEDRILNLIYDQENNTEIFLSKPFVFKEQNNQPYTIWASDRKIDGEITDSWRNFRVNNPITVDGQYNQINKIINFKDKLFYYQEKGFGIAAVEERTINSDNIATVQETTLGVGGILTRYDYISTETGIIHTTAVTKCLYSIYHFDALGGRIFKYSSDGLDPLSTSKYINSDIRGLLINGKIKQKDKPLINRRCSIVSCFDKEFNNVYFTVFYQRMATDLEDFREKEFAETISYNELANIFESKHDHKPSSYLNTGKKMLSIDFNQAPVISDRDNHEVYIHNKDNYGLIYKQYYDCYIKLLINKEPKVPKRFDIIELETNITLNGQDTSFGINPVQETVNKMRCSTDYQMGAIITLVPGLNIRRRFRRWTTKVSRDTINGNNMSAGYFPRMRDNWLYLEIWYTNNNNKRILIHDILTWYN